MYRQYDPLHKHNLAINIAREFMSQDEVPLGARPKSLRGAGVYAIYYSGNFPHYDPLVLFNDGKRVKVPIYVGKADPKGARKGVKLDPDVSDECSSIYQRLGNHIKRISASENLKVEDFSFRCVVLDHVWIRLAESGMIAIYNPLWNQVLDGFGNKIPGKKRQHQSRSAWDTIHPGKGWPEILGPERKEKDCLCDEIEKHLGLMVPPNLGISLH